jgi:site-specific recombinase XerD
LGEGFIDKDPFLMYKPKKVHLKLIYLTPQELSQLIGYKFHQKRLMQVKDLFIFCCYTGLAYKEMSNFNKEHIVKWKDGSLWIEMIRDKTQRMISVPLLPRAIEVLEKYDYSLPQISNQKMNSYLKEIAEIVGIKKKISHHIARKTFATTVLLYNDVPLEVVSKLLGHAKMRTTQEHYGEILKSKILEYVEKLKRI